MTAPAAPGVGDVVALEVGPVAHGGHCVARLAGRVVFVRHTLPGEMVHARLTEARPEARFWRADAVDILRASPDRVPPRCPASGAGGCGGCDWQHVDLTAQRRLKAAVVAEQLRRLAGLDWATDDVAVEPVPGDVDGLAWRTRVRLAVGNEGRAGLRRYRSHEVVALTDCPLAHPELALSELLARRWTPGDEVVVAGGAGVEATVQRMHAGRVSLLQGPSRRREQAGERRWRVSGAGFWQVHPGAAQALLGAVREALRPGPGDTLLDLYAGVGLFAGSLAADLGPTGRAVAVESDAAAMRDARRNLHDLPTVTLVAERVERFLLGPDAPAGADLVVLDPPRSGAGARVVSAIVERVPRRVAYVACDPAALARDLRTFGEHGYGLAGLRTFDIFPMTHHVECVATVVRTGSKDPPSTPSTGRMVAEGGTSQ